MGHRENVYEMIAMYLTALPVPPLPVWVRRCQAEEESYTSSHDLLAGLLVAAMDRNRADLNRQRMQKQQTLIDAFVKEEATYEACVRFTGQFVLAFCDPAQSTPQVRFGDLGDVSTGDRIHGACVHWMVAQDILRHPKDLALRRPAEHLAKLSYAELLTAWCRE